MIPSPKIHQIILKQIVMKNHLLKLAGFAIILLLTAFVFSCTNKDTLKPPSVIIGTDALIGAKDGGNVVLAIVANTDWTVEVPTDATCVAAAPLKSA